MLLAAVVLPYEGPSEPPERTALQGWFYALIKRVDPKLHDAKGPKPFTLGVIKGEQPALRITFLNEDLYAQLSPPLWGLVGKEVPIGGRPYRITALLEEGHPWAGLTTYPRLFQTEPTSDYPLFFASPAFFRRWGTHYPLPEPRLVFGSLLKRFQAFAPVKPREDLNEAFEHLTLRHYELKTQPIEHDVRGVGFRGRATFHLLEAQGDEETRRWLTALWRFSFYAGVGAKTTLGFGQTTPYAFKARGKEEEDVRSEA